MAEEKKYYGRGGWHGGGRPRKEEGEKKITVSLCATKNEIEKLKQLAKEKNKSVSRYILDIVLQD